MTKETKEILQVLFYKYARTSSLNNMRYLNEADLLELAEDESFPVDKPVVQKIAKLVEIQTNPDTSFLFSHVRTNKEVPDDEIWVSYKNGKLQKFKLL